MRLFLVLLLAGCSSEPADNPIPDPTDPDSPWELTWSDEFNGDEGALPDPDKWAHDVGGWGWGNNELQTYTDDGSNAKLTGDGVLRITAFEEEGAWTSARLKTDGLFTQQGGRFEARIRVPEGRGFWPAFWMLGDEFATTGWPQTGEIDILEMRGSAPRELLGTVHGPGYSGSNSVGGSLLRDDPLSDDFHTYAVEWADEEIRWFFDERIFHSVIPADLPEGTPWVFDHPFFLIVNLAVGGNFVLPPDETTPAGAHMLVDHVRVYRPRE